MWRLHDLAARRVAVGALAAATAVLAATVAQGDIMLHERLPPDPDEDLHLGATTVGGAMAAAIQTTSGAVTAPEVAREPTPAEPVYRQAVDGPAAPSSYQIDANTTQPAFASYHDPFTPTVTPFKRVQAFDTVTSELELTVADPALRPLPVGGKARSGDDQFYGDLQVDLQAGAAVRIPSVGPQARVLALEVTPPTSVALEVDGAGSWFVRSEVAGRVRVIMHLAADRRVFDEDAFAGRAGSWRRLRHQLPRVAEAAQRVGLEVASRIGVSRQQTPAAVLASLVAHFRGFSPSSELPSGRGAELYQELALGQKGVCRHRSYAFVVTALALGLPARMVVNEAHAWVEVGDGRLWHRVDLGGAVGELLDATEQRPEHVPPQDAFEWPAGSSRGQQLGRGAQGAVEPGPVNSEPDPLRAPRRQQPAEPESPLLDEPREDERSDLDSLGLGPRPASRVTVRLAAGEAHRGDRVPISGTVTAEGKACAHVRVDLALSAPAASAVPLTALVTDGAGRYEGRVVVPFTVGVGDYSVVATTPGGATCGGGSSQ